MEVVASAVRVVSTWVDQAWSSRGCLGVEGGESECAAPGKGMTGTRTAGVAVCLLFLDVDLVASGL